MSVLARRLRRSWWFFAAVFCVAHVSLAGAAHAEGATKAKLEPGAQLELVVGLPYVPQLETEDKVHIDIGRIRGGSEDGKLVGHIGSDTEYIDMPDEMLARLIRYAGYHSIRNLRAKLQPTEGARETSTFSRWINQLHVRLFQAEQKEMAAKVAKAMSGPVNPYQLEELFPDIARERERAAPDAGFTFDGPRPSKDALALWSLMLVALAGIVVVCLFRGVAALINTARR